jgi:hypothetical protein
VTGAGGVSTLTHDQCAGLLALSALHALDPDEELEVQSHIGSCPVCRREFTDYLEVVAHLALTNGPIVPHRDVRQRLLSAAAQDLPCDNPCRDA